MKCQTFDQIKQVDITWMFIRCMENICSKWWLDGDLLSKKVKNHLKQIQDHAYL